MNRKQYAKDASIGKKAVSLFPLDKVRELDKIIKAQAKTTPATVYIPAKDSSKRPQPPAVTEGIVSNFSLERVRARSRSKRPFVSTPVVSQFSSTKKR